MRLPPYVRNRLKFPANIADNLAFLRAWQPLFDGDAFTYEYYFMWDCYFDPGYWEAAKVLNEDVKKLRQIGLNGIVSDQTQRSFFPTGFGMYVMARTLWDESVDVDGLAAEYFPAAFGADGEAARAYLAEMSRLFDPPYLRGDRTHRGEEEHVWILQPDGSGPRHGGGGKLAQIPALIDGFLPTIERNLGSGRSVPGAFVGHAAVACRCRAGVGGGVPGASGGRSAGGTRACMGAHGGSGAAQRGFPATGSGCL